MATLYDDITIDTPFSEVLFPPKISWGSSGGPGFKTSTFAVDSGLIGGVVEWERLRAAYSVHLNFLTEAQMDAVQDHFYAMRGMAIGFRYKDWNDYTLGNQNFFVGDGTTTVFQLFKRYASAQYKVDRIIRKPVTGTLGNILLDNVIKTDGVDYTVDYTTGEVTWAVAPVRGSVGRISFVEFDVPVRHNIDFLDVVMEDFDRQVVPTLPMVEILV
jgi:uncharacterized protein (TIGR02217 family)